jgi:hypothetical protein
MEERRWKTIMKRTNWGIIIGIAVGLSVVANTAIGFIALQVLKPRLKPPAKETVLVKETSKPAPLKTDLEGLKSSIEALVARVKALESQEHTPTVGTKELKEIAHEVAELRKMVNARRVDTDTIGQALDENPELEDFVADAIETREIERRQEWIERRQERIAQRREEFKKQMEGSFSGRLEEMTEVLGLSWGQRDHVEEAMSTFQTATLEQLKKIDWFNPQERRSGMQRFREVREEYDGAMRATLTSQQYKQYEENRFAPGAQLGRRRWGAQGRR